MNKETLENKQKDIIKLVEETKQEIKSVTTKRDLRIREYIHDLIAKRVNLLQDNLKK